MAETSFYARGDGSTANNANLNIRTLVQQPTILITFRNDIPGDGIADENGDLWLDHNGGLNDPDTTLIVNGVEYAFRLELIGTLPEDGKVPVPLRGRTAAIVSYIDQNGVYRRLFFVLDSTVTLAQMNAFGNGALTLIEVDFDPPPQPVCFCAGTRILTPAGYRRVETLAAGDLVLNDRGAGCRLIWTGQSRYAGATLAARPELRPVRIARGALGHGRPVRDLLVSPQHRIVLDGPEVALLTGEDRVLVAATYLVGSLADVALPAAGVGYVHLLCAEHEILQSDGICCESFQPARRTLEQMSGASRARLEAALDAEGRTGMLARRDALVSLRRRPAVALGHAIASARRKGARGRLLPAA
jgi:hypothetical protein